MAKLRGHSVWRQGGFRAAQLTLGEKGYRPFCRFRWILNPSEVSCGSSRRSGPGLFDVGSTHSFRRMSDLSKRADRSVQDVETTETENHREFGCHRSRCWNWNSRCCRSPADCSVALFALQRIWKDHACDLQWNRKEDRWVALWRLPEWEKHMCRLRWIR